MVLEVSVDTEEGGNECRKISQQATALVQARDVGDLDQKGRMEVRRNSQTWDVL